MRRAGAGWARAVAAATALAAGTSAISAAPVLARTPVGLHGTSPRQLLDILLADMGGMAGPRLREPPLWRSYLSDPTAALQRQLDARDGADRWDALRLDWLCQCLDRTQAAAPAQVLRQTRAGASAALHVRISLNTGERHMLTVLFVNQHAVQGSGWRIDDIVNHRGARFTTALAQGLRDHDLRRGPLP